MLVHELKEWLATQPDTRPVVLLNYGTPDTYFRNAEIACLRGWPKKAHYDDYTSEVTCGMPCLPGFGGKHENAPETCDHQQGETVVVLQ